MDYNRDLTVTREEALSLLFQNWKAKPETELIPLQKALGRVTARDVYSKNSLPVYRSSQRDGIAVRSADFSGGMPDTSAWEKGREYVQADTGDDFPDGFDSVIAVEDIYYNEQGQLFFSDSFAFKKGSGINRQGSMVSQGELLLTAHSRITPIHLAVLAAGGIVQLEVLKKPTIVYIPTGSELVNAGIRPRRGQNVESNGLMVSAFLEQWGAEAVCYPIIKDKQAELSEALDMALAVADIVLINGGSSKGAEDFNSYLLQDRASFFRHGIRAIPGKPVAISIIDGKPVINLPGPINATFLAMDWCVCGLVHYYFGMLPPVRPKITVKLEHYLDKKPDFERYYRLILSKQGEDYRASSIEFGKSIPHTLVKTDALFIAPIGAMEYLAGDEVEVELLCGLENIG